MNAIVEFAGFGDIGQWQAMLDRHREVFTEMDRAPGCRRWCRGAPPTTASSRPTCSTGTAASPTARRACWWSRRPASATCRAGRCCASATTASCPACATGRHGARTQRRPHAAPAADPRLPVDQAPAEKAKFFARFLPSPDAPRAVRDSLRRRRGADEARARARSPTATTTRCAQLLTPREFRDYAFGHRERGERPAPAARARTAARAARPVRRRRGARARRRLRRRRAALRPRLHDGVVPVATNVRDDGYGGSPQRACGCRSRCSPRCARASGRLRVGARFLGDEVIAGGSPLDDAIAHGVAFARAGLRLPVDQQGRQVRRRQAAERRRGRVSVHRPVRPRVHADGAQRRARAVRPQRAARRRDPRRGARRRPHHAGGHRRRASATSRRWRRSCSAAKRTSSRRRGRASPIRTGGRRCAGPRRRSAALQVHQLLRRARPEAQAGDLPAVGSRLHRRRAAAQPRRQATVVGAVADHRHILSAGADRSTRR
jgi:hypothetical protein